MQRPFFISYNTTEASRYLSVYAHYSKNEASDYINKTLEENPQNVVELLKLYIPTSWSMETGLSHKSDFSREVFDSVAYVADIVSVYNAICKIYHGDLNVTEYHYREDNKISYEENIIRQFLFIYNKVKNEGVEVATAEEQTNSDLLEETSEIIEDEINEE